MIRVNRYGAKRMNDETRAVGETDGGDTSGLILTSLTTRRERDAVESESINSSYSKYIYRAKKKTTGTEWLTDELIREVHHSMFGSIWNWGGKYRTTSIMNIGLPPYKFPEQIHLLCGDFRYWDSTGCSMTIVEIAARLQNRLTRIHPFEDGNGRHSRLITDIFFNSRGQKLPAWPQIHRMGEAGEALRGKYINAMKQADNDDYTELMRFIEQCLAANH